MKYISQTVIQSLLIILFVGGFAGPSNESIHNKTSPSEAPSYHSVEVETVQIIIDAGWNLISLPLSVPDGKVSALFPTAISNAFAYEGRYVQKETLEFGKGYWLKFAATETITVVGVPSPYDSLLISSGWNMIGAYVNPAAVSSLISEPQNNLLSNFYTYDAVSGYIAADTLQPGKGHWVKARERGSLFSGRWRLLSLENENVVSIAVHPNDTNIIYAYASGKLFKTINGGMAWDTLMVGGNFYDIAIDPIHPETLYATSIKVFKSTNGGTTWFEIINGMDLDWAEYVGPLVIDPLNTNILYCGTGGFDGGNFYKSTNGGENWMNLSRGDTLIEGVISIAIDPTNSNIVYVGTPWTGRLWETTDAGETWIVTGLGITNQMIDAVAVSPFNSNIVYASVRSMGLFASDDGGISWRKTQLPDTIGVSAILFSNIQSSSIYLTTTYGCIMTIEGDSNWIFLNGGFENYPMKALNTMVFYKNEYFLLAGKGNGIFIRGI
jgi:hypothetical protein